MRRVIEKKILNPFADAVLAGEKTFEIRKNDEDYQKGDVLKFKVMDNEHSHNPTHPLNDREYEITYVLSGWGIQEGYVALGIVPRVVQMKGAVTDYIDRQAIIEVLAVMQGQCTSKAALIQNSKIWQQIKDLPSAEVEPVKRGKWTRKDDRDTYGIGAVFWYECSNCGGIAYYECPYCPNCGAKMDAEEVPTMEEFMFGQDTGSEEDGSL